MPSLSSSASRKGTSNETTYTGVSNTFLPSLRNERNDKPSWKAPATMLSALVLGFGIALTQHFTYASLHNLPVSAVPISQEWVSRISTGLAFAAKVALTICAGTAYIQHQWLRLQRMPFRVSEVDKLTGILGNMFLFMDSTVWYRHPVLSLMALATWTLPLAAIVTPGALSVDPVQFTATVQSHVPQPLYNSTNYWITDGKHVLGESPKLTKLLMYTACSQTPIQLESVHQNQTYSLKFYGPALKCRSASDSVIRSSSIQYGAYGNGNYSPFATRVWHSVGGPLNVFVLTNNGDARFGFNEVEVDADEVGLIADDRNWNGTVQYQYEEAKPGDDHHPDFIKVNVTECLLYNVMYDADFIFRYPKQEHNLRIATWLDPVSVSLESEIGGLGNTESKFDDWLLSDQDGVNSYYAMMSAFTSFLGAAVRALDNTRANYDLVTIDWSQAETVQTGLASLFQNFTLGLLSDSNFVKNSTEADLVDVKLELWPITYVYSPLDLVVAYGLSLIAALVCTFIGLRAFFANDASYQNMFSTYLRATSDAGLALYIHGDDAGEDPLPRELAEATVDNGRVRVESDSVLNVYSEGSRKEDSRIAA